MAPTNSARRRQPGAGSKCGGREPEPQRRLGISASVAPSVPSAAAPRYRRAHRQRHQAALQREKQIRRSGASRQSRPHGPGGFAFLLARTPWLVPFEAPAQQQELAVRRERDHGGSRSRLYRTRSGARTPLFGVLGSLGPSSIASPRPCAARRNPRRPPTRARWQPLQQALRGGARRALNQKNPPPARTANEDSGCDQPSQGFTLHPRSMPQKRPAQLGGVGLRGTCKNNRYAPKPSCGRIGLQYFVRLTWRSQFSYACQTCKNTEFCKSLLSLPVPVRSRSGARRTACEHGRL